MCGDHSNLENIDPADAGGSRGSLASLVKRLLTRNRLALVTRDAKVMMKRRRKNTYKLINTPVLGEYEGPWKKFPLLGSYLYCGVSILRCKISFVWNL